ncbi:MAG: hypothetical protein SF052_08230 [Bacteroidia bacterium]|nr:hypothetical protein [Bacteroidia bacterium]
MKKNLLSLLVLIIYVMIFFLPGCKPCSPPVDGCPGGGDFDYEECVCLETCSPKEADIQACINSGGDFDYETCQCFE